jgi:hypothetical protein
MAKDYKYPDSTPVDEPVKKPKKQPKPMPKAMDDSMMDESTEAFAKGGYVRKADGCATRGLTRGKMV